MPEMRFYHLLRQPLEAVLPKLLELSLARGWRVVVQAGSDERVDALDAHLWTYRDDSFLPHGTARDRDAAEHPVVLTSGADNRNGAGVRFLLDGTGIPPDAASYERLVFLFDGSDQQAVAHARACWQEGKAAGFDLSYWQQNESGGWERKA